MKIYLESSIAKMLARGLLALGLVCAGAGAASADAWQGFYLGLDLGGQFNRSHATTTTVFSPTGYFASSSVPSIATTGNHHMSSSNLAGSVETGWNWRDGNLVYGLEGDFTLGTQTANATSTHTYPCCAPTAFTIGSSIKTSWMATARPRLGMILGNDNELLYVTGGVAVAEEKVGFTFTDTFATASSFGLKTSDRVGWTLGGGVAYPWAPGWSVKFEYLYANFGTTTVPGSVLTAFTPPIAFPTSVFMHTATLQENIVRVGIDYQFN